MRERQLFFFSDIIKPSNILTDSLADIQTKMSSV